MPAKGQLKTVCDKCGGMRTAKYVKGKFAQLVCLPCVAADHRQRYINRTPRYEALQKAWKIENRHRLAGYTAAYRLRNPMTEAQRERAARFTTEWCRKHPERASAIRSRRRARLLLCEGSHTGDEWKAVLKKHGRKCVRCGSKKRLEKDHIIPLSRGGTDYAYNLQPLCKTCNLRKHARIERGAQHSLFDALR